MTMALALTIALSAVTICSHADALTGGILYGPGWGLLVQAPDGWLMDDQSWQSHGIYGLFYEQGKRPEPPNPIIYIASAPLGEGTEESLNAFVDQYVQKVRSDPANTCTELDPIKLKDGTNARLIRFVYSGGKQFEEIAYLRYKDSIHQVILTTRSLPLLLQTEPKLLQVISSIGFMERK